MEESPIRALQRFTQLDTFTFRIGRGICFWSETEETTYNVDTLRNLSAFGVAMLVACPTLSQVAVGGEPIANRVLKCTLTRISENCIRIEDADEFDFDAVSKFWKP
jgi:hypothetical protein